MSHDRAGDEDRQQEQNRQTREDSQRAVAQIGDRIRIPLQRLAYQVAAYCEEGAHTELTELRESVRLKPVVLPSEHGIAVVTITAYAANKRRKVKAFWLLEAMMTFLVPPARVVTEGPRGVRNAVSRRSLGLHQKCTTICSRGRMATYTRRCSVWRETAAPRIV